MEKGVFSLPVTLALIPLSSNNFTIFFEISEKVTPKLSLLRIKRSVINFLASGFKILNAKSSSVHENYAFPFSLLMENKFPWSLLLFLIFFLDQQYY